MNENIEWSPDEMVEVGLRDPQDFLKVKETLTRIGVSSRREKKLFQSCHILHKQGKYYIVHFKELFALDKKPTNFSENDLARRNTITNLLAEWGLVDIVSPEATADPAAPLSQIKILAYGEKTNGNFARSITLAEKRKNKISIRPRVIGEYLLIIK